MDNEKSKTNWSVSISLDKERIARQKRVVKTEADYKKIAESILRSATDLENIIIAYIQNQSSLFIANIGIMANVFFVSELYLKAVLYYRTVHDKSLYSHDLYALFGLLDDPSKQEIELLCNAYAPIKNYTDFLRELKNIKDGFEVLRYSYELNGFAYNVSFALGLMCALKHFAEQEIEKKKTE